MQEKDLTGSERVLDFPEPIRSERDLGGELWFQKGLRDLDGETEASLGLQSFTDEGHMVLREAIFVFEDLLIALYLCVCLEREIKCCDTRKQV